MSITPQSPTDIAHPAEARVAAPGFADLGVSHHLVRALQRRGVTSPFPIQAVSLADSLAGRDVLGKGRTGSGKTIAFALPLVQRLAEQGARRRHGRPRALVLVPTRELAIQVAETVEALASVVGLKAMTILGGVRYAAQVGRLERGVDLVVATPGRLEDLLDQGVLTLGDVAAVVVDEADLMADMGFLPPVTRILEQVPPGQRMLFSATLDGDVQVLVDRFLRDPLIHSVDEEKANAGVHHHLFLVSHDNKHEVLTELVTGAGRTLLFVRTKTFAEKLASELTSAGIPSGALHGNLRQGARQRNLAAFADGTVGVLVATDIAARGIHVDDIGLVVHVDPPTEPKAFLHRSGRTARAGAEGAVVTLATRNQNKAVRALMAQAKIKPASHLVVPGADIIAEVRAPLVVRRGVGASMFEPDPDEVVLDDEPRGRTAGGSGRGDRRASQPPRGAGGRDGRRAPGPREGRLAPGPRPEREERRARQPQWRDVADTRTARRRADAWEGYEEGRRDATPGDERPRSQGAREERPRFQGAREERPRFQGAREERPRFQGAREERSSGRRFGGDGPKPDPWGRRSEAAASVRTGGRGQEPQPARTPGKAGKKVKAKVVKHKRRH